MRRETLAIVAAVSASGIIFLASMLTATGGRLSMPLDDSFIYFQYAKQLADGRFLVYQTGEAPTSGATSIPWTACMAVGSLLGLEGRAAIVFAMIIAGVLLAAAARFAGDAARSMGGKGSFAIALVLLSGPLAWGIWSGMEIALFAVVIAGAFRAWCASEGRLTPGVAAWLAGLALVRPEGAVLAGVAAALAAAGALRERRIGEAARALVPLAAILVVPLVLLMATGEARSSGFLSKSMFAEPGASFLSVVRTALLRAASLAASLFGGAPPRADGLGLYAYESETAVLFAVPFAGILFALGALPEIGREIDARRAGPGILALAWVASLLIATATINEDDAHFGRYQMPILPIVLVFVALGIERLREWVRAAPGNLSRLGGAIVPFTIVASLVQLAFFALAYGDNCEDIDRMQIRLAETIRDTTELSDVIAINDAGALAYFSDRRTLDLVGLTTPGFAGLWTQGPGVLVEKIESLPEGRRPDWFCFFPNWFDFGGLDLWQRKGSVRLLSPSIVDAEKVLARADMSFVGTGDQPRLGAPEPGAPQGASWRVVDRLDVADVDSERAHEFTQRTPEHGADSGSFARRTGFVGRPDDTAFDGGRTIFGEVTFTLERHPIAPAEIVVRTMSGARQRLLVSIDEEPERRVEVYAPGTGLFHEQGVGIVAPGPGRARVRLRVVPEAADSAPLLLLHVFGVEGHAR